MEVTIRRARTSDVAAVRRLVDGYARERILLNKPTVTLFESVQEFWVAERDDNAEVVACGALHVMWEDLAEVRTLAVDLSCRGTGIGHQLLEKLIQTARWIGVRRIFCLTFEVDFFTKHGFVEIESGRCRRVRGAAPQLRRRRGRVPRPGTCEAEHLG
jgi:amino-acid N-acetyltransferase